MSFKKCPGAGAFSQPRIEIVICPDCGGNAEIWSDEAEGKCPSCGKTVIRTTSQSCVDWCPSAKECLGEAKYKRYQDMKAQTRKDALLAAVDEHFGNQKESRQLARQRMAIAEGLLRQDKRSNPNVVIAAALLYDVERSNEINTSNRVNGSGGQTARKIMEELAYPPDFIKEVQNILDRGRAVDQEESVNSRIVHDADLAVHKRDA